MRNLCLLSLLLLTVSCNQSVQMTDTVLQVSQGAFVHLPIYRCGNLHQQLSTLKKEGFWIIGVENSVNAISWHQLDYKRKLVLVMGLRILIK